MPDHWVQVRLDSVAEVRLGRQRSPERANGPNMVPYLRAANVTWRGIDLTDVKKMDFTATEVETYRLRDGDILLSEASGSAGEVGKPARYSSASGLHCFQNTLIRVRAGDELVRFLQLHFLGDALLGRFAKASRGVGIHHLGAEALAGWQVSLPPVGEQHRIADATDSYLSRLDAAIATLEAAQAKLKAYRAAVLKAAAEGRLVPTEAALARVERRDFEPADVLLKRILSERRRRWEEAELAKLKTIGKSPRDDKWKAKYEEPKPPDKKDLPKLPVGWCWASFEQLTSLITSGSRGWAEYYAEEGATFIRAQDIKTDALVLEAIAHVVPPKGAEGSRTAVHQFDLLVTITGANVTKTALVEQEVGEAYVSQHVGLCRPVEPATAPYLHTFVVCPSAGRRYLEKVAYGAGKPGLNLDNLKQMAVALPPSSEALRIVDTVDQFVSDARHSELVVAQSGRRIRRLRQAILKWAFQGKLVDQDPNDEPAEKLLERIRAERAGRAAPQRLRRAQITQ